MHGFYKATLAAVIFALALLAGCGGGAYYAGVAVGPPPPPPVYGPVGIAPGPGYIWINGYYDLDGDRWVWRPGGWRRPPDRYDRWVEPRWEHRGDRWERRGGYWHHRGEGRDFDHH
jgi:hypothetical protein